MGYSHHLYEALNLVCQLIITYEKKLVSSLELSVIFDERFKVLFLIPNFNLLNCELDNVEFKLIY